MFVNGNDLAEITERLVFWIVGKEKRIKCSIQNRLEVKDAVQRHKGMMYADRGKMPSSDSVSETAQDCADCAGAQFSIQKNSLWT